MCTFGREDVLPKPEDLKWSLKGELGEFFAPLVTACFTWSFETEILFVDESKLVDAFKHANVQKIKDITNELTKNGKEKLVGKFLLELGRNYSHGFLILYVYLFGHIPEQYSRFNLIFLGLSKNLPDILRKHGLIEWGSQN